MNSMPKARNSYNFSHRFQLAFEIGSKRELRIPCPTEARALHLRAQINSYRSAAMKENKTNWGKLYDAGVYIEKAEPKVVVIRPKSLEWKDVLDAAGIPDLLEDDPTPTAPAAATNDATSEEELQSFFAELKKLEP
jgi:hypothetical protein